MPHRRQRAKVTLSLLFLLHSLLLLCVDGALQLCAPALFYEGLLRWVPLCSNPSSLPSLPFLCLGLETPQRAPHSLALLPHRVPIRLTPQGCI